MFSNKNTSELPVGEGLFRKQGSTVKNWKVRQYALFSSSSELQYSDAQTGAVKGSMSVGNVSIREGAKENCKASGAPKEGYSMDICSFNDSRNLEVVFDSGAEARRFLKLLAKVAKKHNLSVSVRPAALRCTYTWQPNPTPPPAPHLSVSRSALPKAGATSPST